MEGQDPSLDDQGRALGHLLDDTDIREAGNDAAPDDQPEVPDSLKLEHADPEPEAGSVLDQIDDGPPPGLV